MLRPDSLLLPRLFPLVVAAACLLVIDPVHAVAPVASTDAPPVDPALPAPIFLNRAPLGELRPVDGNPDLASASDSVAVSDQTALPQPLVAAAQSRPDPAASPSSAAAPAPDTTEASAPDSATPPAGSGDGNNAWKSSYISLVNLLVQRGVLTKKDSGDLISQASQAAEATSSVVTAPAPSEGGANSDGGGDDTVRVVYVPDSVKAQIRDEVKDDVLKQARDENWAQPNAIPEWVTRYHVAADLRFRYEGDFFPDGNDDSGIFHNFNAINTGSPYDVGTQSNNALDMPSPSYDVNQNRNRFRLRARIGAAVDVGDGFTAGMRVGSGQDDSPVTENQTLGLANNGQGGDFSKYAIWLDRAFLRYETGSPNDWSFSAEVGRFDNPFFGSTMIWANDIGFDGARRPGQIQSL